MRVTLDKLASSTRNVPLRRSVIVGDTIPAQPGTLLAVEVLDEKRTYNQLEDPHGRMMTVHQGDRLAVVLGERRALRGYSGTVPDQIHTGDILHLLNLGGIVGHCTSASPEVGPPARVRVLGAILRFQDRGLTTGEPASILPGPVPLADTLTALPKTVFVAGSCMHAGKTAAACALVHQLTARGLRVGATKITGVALRRDTLEMQDHGAEVVYTFADTGLPSTCGGADAVRAARGCLNACAAHDLDVLIVELGDGLLGEYGVAEILSTPDLAAAADALVLAATDPVAAFGGARLLQSMRCRLDVVTGPATDNSAGINAIHRTIGCRAANARTEPTELADHVIQTLGLQRSPTLAIQGAQ